MHSIYVFDTMKFTVEYLPRLQTTTVYADIPINNLNVELNGTKLALNGEDIDVIQGITKPVISKVPVSSSLTCVKIQPEKIEVLRNADDLSVDRYQWNIGDFKGNYSLYCKSCNNCVMSSKNVSKIMPMPSSLWYEMVDYWHCHKPHEDGPVKYMKRFNQLVPRERGVIVGSYFFIINPGDWNLLAVDEELFCQCGEVLGDKDFTFGNYKLLKWKLSLSNHKYDDYNMVYCRFFEEIKYTAGRIFTLTIRERKVCIWCFGFDIDVNINGTIMRKALKILFKDTAEVQGEELDLEYELPYVAFLKHIEMVNASLLEHLQTYKEWKVSYIPQ
ncbi:uncharacterized protein C5L36_0A01870 [Pichia kudriavzevii]|uniref:E3 ubiquitin-protein ligase E3D n=2 Tax=Pichia kudriavzevii TaxID=4909 RepID=A0A2U9QX34_PICKU|nr:uncharacterized protein C5L36_0A01870 [Pichia kudriavzevii]AWU73580.1 hypothetical protein C5L36_0A01870 [Pichia kudriavzevii]